MPDVLFSWAVIGAVIAILVTVGGSVLSMTPPDFTVARWSFSLSFLILAARLGWWLAAEQTAESDNGKVALYAFVLFGVLGLLWTGTIRWINGKQKTAPPPQIQGTITQEQPSALMSVAMTPKSFPSWTPPTGKFYTGLRECIRRGHDLLKFYQSVERESDRQHREWRIGVDDYIASHARDAGKGSFAIRWRRHISPNDYPTLPIEIHGRNRNLYTDIFSRMELLEEFIRELDS